MSRRQRAAIAATAVAAVAAIGGCGPAAGDSHASAPAATGRSTGAGGRSTSTAAVVARDVAPYGDVLTTAEGYALYVFAPDRGRSVTCTGTCAGTWPPLVAHAAPAAAAGTGVERALLGSDPEPGGSDRVLTYAGWPLYTYVGDPAPGYASGQDLDLNGGYWYLMSPDGSLVRSTS